jgi:hypothetical protein
MYQGLCKVVTSRLQMAGPCQHGPITTVALLGLQRAEQGMQVHEELVTWHSLAMTPHQEGLSCRSGPVKQTVPPKVPSGGVTYKAYVVEVADESARHVEGVLQVHDVLAGEGLISQQVLCAWTAAQGMQSREKEQGCSVASDMHTRTAHE